MLTFEFRRQRVFSVDLVKPLILHHPHRRSALAMDLRKNPSSSSCTITQVLYCLRTKTWMPLPSSIRGASGICFKINKNVDVSMNREQVVQKWAISLRWIKTTVPHRVPAIYSIRILKSSNETVFRLMYCFRTGNRRKNDQSSWILTTMRWPVQIFLFHHWRQRIDDFYSVWIFCSGRILCF